MALCINTDTVMVWENSRHISSDRLFVCVRKHAHTHTHTHRETHAYIYIYIYIYMCVWESMCACVCVWFDLIGFYGKLTIVGYLMPYPLFIHKTVLFQTIQFCISTQFISIWSIDRTLCIEHMICKHIL